MTLREFEDHFQIISLRASLLSMEENIVRYKHTYERRRFKKNEAKSGVEKTRDEA